MAMAVDGPSGRDTRTVRFFDFDDPHGGLNEFVITTQFRVRRGNEKGDMNDASAWSSPTWCSSSTASHWW